VPLGSRSSQIRELEYMAQAGVRAESLWRGMAVSWPGSHEQSGFVALTVDGQRGSMPWYGGLQRHQLRLDGSGNIADGEMWTMRARLLCVLYSDVACANFGISPALLALMAHGPVMSM